MARDGIENDAADLDCRLGVAEFPPQNGAAAGLKLGVIEGFGDIVIGAQIQGTDSIRHLASGGQNDHRGVQITGAMLFQERTAIAIGQHDIEKDQVVLPGLNESRGVL